MNVECPYCGKKLKSKKGIKIHLTLGLKCVPLQSITSQMSAEYKREILASKLESIKREIEGLEFVVRYYFEYDLGKGIDHPYLSKRSKEAHNHISRQVNECKKLLR